MFFSVMLKIFQILIGFLHALTFLWFIKLDKAGKAPMKKPPIELLYLLKYVSNQSLIFTT